MARKEGKVVIVSLSLGIVLAAIATAALWPHDTPHTSRMGAPSKPVEAENAISRSSTDNEMWKAELERLKNTIGRVARGLAETNRDVTSLQSSMTKVQGPHQLTTPETTLEEEIEQAKVQARAQVEFFEGAMRGEAVDSQWKNQAELSLKETLTASSEEVTGVKFVDVECRSTMCRMGLSLDEEASAEETFRKLAYVVPWHSDKFAHINPDNPADFAVYLTREGHALPQVPE